MTARRPYWTFVAILLLCLLVLQLFLLKKLGYAGSDLDWGTVDELAQSRPFPNFNLGSVNWDVEKYSKAPELQVHRDFFNQNCQGLKGLNAASCLSRIFIDRVPVGIPSTELFGTSYSPKENLETHLAGAPGYCVTFSAMTVNSLLSVGIPARYLQTREGDKIIHSITEIWDDERGWVVFDAMNDSALSDGTHLLSAANAHVLNGHLTRVSIGGEEPPPEHMADYYDGENPFTGQLLYPEPWMHTRVGENPNAIYRNRFAVFGKWDPTVGFYQSILRVGILVCGALLLLLTVLAGYRRFMKRRVVQWEPGNVSVGSNTACEEA